MNSLRVGQEVTLIDDDLSGILTEINGDQIFIETNDGFIIESTLSEIIPVKELDVWISEDTLKEVVNEKASKIKKPKFKKVDTAPPMEVDLHIHKLTPKTRGLSNHEMLTLQVETAQRQLEFAIRKRIQKIIFIHGVGEGVLRMELEYLFSRYDTIKFYDADYRKYGLGATEVYIYQNA